MKKAIAKKWIEALRSGKYKQVEGDLRAGDGFCCLGVLCDISHLSGWKRRKYDGEGPHLPSVVAGWSGIKTDIVEFGSRNLVHLNDTGESFSEIALIIEKNWKRM